MSDAPIAPFFGEAPTVVGTEGAYDFSRQWTEFLHYLYLPVRIPTADPDFAGDAALAVPARLGFLTDAIDAAWADARAASDHLDDPYIYVTARRGFASPGNPLNRPGWHTDDFGGTDLNYIWADTFPTRFLLADAPLPISSDDAESMQDMALYAHAAASATTGAFLPGGGSARIVDGPTNTLLRLTPHVIHDTPKVPEPGGMRSFFKISVSTHRYDLVGNSHNHLIDYAWPMRQRAAVRNQPQNTTERSAA